MGAELINLTPTDFVNEGETPLIRAALSDEYSSALTSAAIKELVVTNAIDGVAVNRSSEDINGTNGGSLIDVKKLPFTSGRQEPEINAAVAGATSGANGNVAMVERVSGEWIDGDAAGFIYVSSASGTFESESLNITGGSTNVMTIGGAGEDAVVSLLKLDAADTAFQATGESAETEKHSLFYTWKWDDSDTVERTGSQEMEYTVRRKPTT